MATNDAPFASTKEPVLTDLRCRLAILAVGLVASVPLLVFGFPSSPQDALWHLQWSSHFATQFWQGELYPRWLHELNDGCGSPVFFYYAPLPYWITAMIAPLSGKSTSAWAALGCGASLGLIVSGLTSYQCLRVVTTPIRACLGSSLYMLMPYHFAIDVLQRAAYAEFWAFAWMPIIIGSILQIRAPRSYLWFKMVGGFTLLFLTHLPTTLIFTPLALALAAFDGFKSLLRTGGAALAGCGLTAVYLVPALTTQNAVRIEELWFPYRTEFFFPLFDFRVPLLGEDSTHWYLFYSFLVHTISFICLYYLSILRVRSKSADALRARLLGLTLTTLLMMLPFAEPIYSLFPKLQMIQFPWRFLAPSSLFLIVLLVSIWPELGAPPLYRLLYSGTIVTMVGVIVSLTWVAYSNATLGGVVVTVDPSRPDFPARRDAPEYSPVRSNLNAVRPKMRDAQVLLESGDAEVSLVSVKPRLFRMTVTGKAESAFLVRQFDYPGWVATSSEGASVNIAADAITGLLSIKVPAGRHDIALRLTQRPPERIGWAVTIGSLVILLYLYLSRPNFLMGS